MSEKIDDGGPAFPQPMVPLVGGGYTNVETPGLSLRDYFAAHSEGWENESDFREVQKACGFSDSPARDDAAGWQRWWARADAIRKYMQADAMLAARRALGGGT